MAREKEESVETLERGSGRAEKQRGEKRRRVGSLWGRRGENEAMKKDAVS